MFSRHTQPIMDEIVSIFETTQSQPWSIFSDKLSRLPMETSIRKDIFKSENPIKLSLNRDFPVFGLIPRLEEIKLLSCEKCKMIVKEECIAHHYNRRHNFGNDNFSLKSFLRPTVKSNNHKRQRLNVQKISKKKIINCKIIDPVVQEIKTEFDELEYEELEFENLSKIKLEKFEHETDINYQNDINFEIETHNSITNHVWDTPSLDCYVDHKINDKKLESDINQIQLSSVLQQRKLNRHQYVKTLSDFYKSSDDFIKSLNMNEEISPKMTIDPSNEDKKHKQINNKFKNLCKEKTKLVASDDFPDVISDNNSSNNMSDEGKKEINDNPQSSFGILNNKEETNHNTFINYLDKDKCSCDSVINLYQSPKVSSNIKEGLIPISNNKYSDVISNKKKDNNKITYYKFLHDKELKKYISRFQYPDVKNDKSSCDFSVNSFYQLLLINEGFEFTPNNKLSEIISDKENNYGKSEMSCCQISVEFSDTIRKLSVKPKRIYSVKEYPEVTNLKCADIVTNNLFSSIPPSYSKLLSLLKKNSEHSMNNESSDNENNEAHELYPSRCRKSLKCVIKREEPYEIGDSSLNDFSQLPSESQNLEEETNSTQINEKYSDITNNENVVDTCPNFEESLTTILNNKEKLLSKLLDYSNENSIDSGSSIENINNERYFLAEFINGEKLPLFTPKLNEYSNHLNNYISDESVTSSDLSSVASLDDNEEINNLLTPTYSDIVIDENSDSITSNNESSIKLQNIKKETKYTQTDFNYNNNKQSIDPISKDGVESSLELIDVLHNVMKSTQTDLSINCKVCCINTDILLNNITPVKSCMNNVEIVEGFINSYNSDNSDAQMSKYFVNNLAPITSSAQIIKNPIIPNSSEKYELLEKDDSDEYISFDSYVPPFPNIPESQNNCLANRLTPSTITETTHSLENNDNVNNSETCADKRSDNFLQRNTINGSSFCPIYKDCLKNTSDEKKEKSNISSQNYEIDYTEAKLKNYLKNRYVRKIAKNKKNHKKYKLRNRTKHNRLEFVARSPVYSDESDKNDNVGE